jgi:hypothetical protein
VILLSLALQAAAAAAPVPPNDPPATAPARFSILAKQCGQPDDKGDIVVCGNGDSGNRLPLPDERAPAPGRGANPEVSGMGALALQSTPCAARLAGCTVGFGPPLVPMAVAAVKALKGAFAKKPDKSGRVAIPLDDPAPVGRVMP